MSRRLAIGGAGGLARELFGWLHTSGGKDFLARYDAVSFHVDDRALATNAGDLAVSEFGALRNAGQFDYLIAVSDPALKRSMDARFAELGGTAATFIHSSCVVGRNVAVGEGCVLCPNATVSSDVKIGRCVLVNVATGIGHDCVIGDYVSLLGYLAINGGCKLDNSVVVGSGAAIHPGRRIGEGAVVGIGSTVLTNVAAGVTVLGNPARRLSVLD